MTTATGRDLERAVFGGVCAGIAARSGYPVAGVRAATLAVSVATAGLGGLAYLALWRALPARHSEGVRDSDETAETEAGPAASPGGAPALPQSPPTGPGPVPGGVNRSGAIRQQGTAAGAEPAGTAAGAVHAQAARLVAEQEAAAGGTRRTAALRPGRGRSATCQAHDRRGGGGCRFRLPGEDARAAARRNRKDDAAGDRAAGGPPRYQRPLEGGCRWRPASSSCTRPLWCMTT